MLSEALCSFGVLAEYLLDDVPDSNTVSAFDAIGIDLEKYRKRISDEDVLFLVDHHETKYENKIIGCIDHHPTEQNLSFEIYYNKPSSSCALSIFRLLENEGMRLDKRQTELAVLSVYMDTNSCKSTKFFESDRAWITSACEKYSFDKALFEQLGFFMTDTSLPIDKLSQNGFKEYSFGKKKVYASHVQCKDNEENAKKLVELRGYIARRCRELDIAMWILIYIDPIKEMTSVYKITKDNEFVYSENRILSRSMDVIPKIEREFLQNG